MTDPLDEAREALKGGELTTLAYLTGIPIEDVKRVSGVWYTFDTRGGYSVLNHRSGERCQIIAPLTEKEADLDEVGPMYHVRFVDGFMASAFGDELTEIVERPDSTAKENPL